MNLFLIGNGFDLAHNMKTSFNDWGHFIKSSNKKEEEDFLNDFSSYVAPKDSWGQYEDNLEYVPLNICEEANYLEKMGDYWDGLSINRFKKLSSKCLDDWLITIKISKIKLENFANMISKDSYFITFNYTSTLEELYGISDDKIWHIHNFFNDSLLRSYFGLEGSAQMVLGCSTNFKFGKNVSENIKSQFIKAISKDSKKIFTSDSKGLLKKLKSMNVENIYVIGVSIDNADKYYFIELKRMFPSALWHSSFYKNKEELKNKYNELGIQPLF